MALFVERRSRVPVPDETSIEPLARVRKRQGLSVEGGTVTSPMPRSVRDEAAWRAKQTVASVRTNSAVVLPMEGAEMRARVAARETAREERRRRRARAASSRAKQLDLSVPEPTAERHMRPAEAVVLGGKMSTISIADKPLGVTQPSEVKPAIAAVPEQTSPISPERNGGSDSRVVTITLSDIVIPDVIPTVRRGRLAVTRLRRGEGEEVRRRMERERRRPIL